MTHCDPTFFFGWMWGGVWLTKFFFRGCMLPTHVDNLLPHLKFFFWPCHLFGSLDGRLVRHLALQHTSHHGHHFGVHEHIQHGRTAYYTAIPLYKAKLVLRCLFQGFQMTLFSWFPLFLHLCCNALGTPTRPLFCDACWQATQQHPQCAVFAKGPKDELHL